MCVFIKYRNSTFPSVHAQFLPTGCEPSPKRVVPHSLYILVYNIYILYIIFVHYIILRHHRRADFVGPEIA